MQITRKLQEVNKHKNTFKSISEKLKKFPFKTEYNNLHVNLIPNQKLELYFQKIKSAPLKAILFKIYQQKFKIYPFKISFLP